MESPVCEPPADSSGRLLMRIWNLSIIPITSYSGVEIIVRARELRCYRGIGAHDWMPAVIGEMAEPEDLLISERPAPLRAPWRDLPFHEPSASPEESVRN